MSSLLNAHLPLQVRRDYLAWTPQNADTNGIDPDIPQEHRHGIGEHSDMIKKASNGNADSGASSETHQDHVAQGDRHAIAVEDQEKEKHA
jgi:ammonium transporter, Amt family